MLTFIMCGAQREVYRSLLARHLPVLGGSSSRASGLDVRPAGPSVTALKNLVMQLRKACNHPYHFPSVEPCESPFGSAPDAGPLHP